MACTLCPSCLSVLESSKAEFQARAALLEEVAAWGREVLAAEERAEEIGVRKDRPYTCRRYVQGDCNSRPDPLEKWCPNCLLMRAVCNLGDALQKLDDSKGSHGRGR